MELYWPVGYSLPRLLVIQERIRSFGPESESGLIVASDADWVEDTRVAGFLGVTALESDLSTRGYDKMAELAATRSLVARESAPFTENVRMGQRPPVFHPSELADLAARAALAKASAAAQAQRAKS